MLSRHERTSNYLSEKEYMGSFFEGTWPSPIGIDVFFWFVSRRVNACFESRGLEMICRLMRRLSL